LALDRLGQVSVDLTQDPPEHWPVVPIMRDHTIPGGTDKVSSAALPGSAQFVLPFGGSLLEKSDAAEQMPTSGCEPNRTRSGSLNSAPQHQHVGVVA
jgi:hypothetical protein